MLLDWRAGEAEVADKGCGGIAGTAAEPAACGDFFVEGDFDAAAEFGSQFGAESIDGAVDEIFFYGFGGERFIAECDEGDARLFGGAEMQRVVERDSLEDGAKFVVAIGAFAKDIELQIDFGEGRNFDLAHREAGRVAEVVLQEKDNAETQRARRFAEKYGSQRGIRQQNQFPVSSRSGFRVGVGGFLGYAVADLVQLFFYFGNFVGFDVAGKGAVPFG